MNSEMHNKVKTHRDDQESNQGSPMNADPISCKCNKDCGCCENRKAKKDESSQVKGKVIVASSIALLIADTATAQGGAPNTSFWTDPFNHPMLPVYLTLTFLGITVLLVFFTMTYLVKVIKLLLHQREVERAEKAGVKYVAPPSMFAKFWQDINDVVPVEKEQDIDLGHSYDGIRELDNHLPPWWKGLFYGCIVWGIGYMIVYHITDSFPLSLDEYKNELTAADESARILRASKPAEVIDENSLSYTADADLIAKGKVVFVSNNCGSCHRADGGGSTIGPNLTDPYWIHGGNIKNIYTTINNGVVEKGMPAWGKVMGAADVRNVAFYIMSLQGSNPKDAKGPQGELDKPAEVTAPADSVVAVAN
jgi:cytochrome c oxidase cbb3-type subunit III